MRPDQDRDAQLGTWFTVVQVQDFTGSRLRFTDLETCIVRNPDISARSAVQKIYVARKPRACPKRGQGRAWNYWQDCRCRLASFPTAQCLPSDRRCRHENTGELPQIPTNSRKLQRTPRTFPGCHVSPTKIWKPFISKRAVREKILSGARVKTQA